MSALILPAALLTALGIGFLLWLAADAKAKDYRRKYDADLHRVENEYEATIDRLGDDLRAEREAREQVEDDLRWARLTTVLLSVDRHGDDDLRREVLGSNVVAIGGAK